MSIDASELATLSADVDKAADKAVKEIEKVIEKAAVNIKKDWRSNARATSGTHARLYPYTITYDKRGPLEVEIGPEWRKQGKLGPILENGSVNNPPHHNGKRAADKEEPKLIKYLEKITGDIL
jgi:HK97 gp10 family phage protein